MDNKNLKDASFHRAEKSTCEDSTKTLAQKLHQWWVSPGIWTKHLLNPQWMLSQYLLCKLVENNLNFLLGTKHKACSIQIPHLFYSRLYRLIFFKSFMQKDPSQHFDDATLCIIHHIVTLCVYWTFCCVLAGDCLHMVVSWSMTELYGWVMCIHLLNICTIYFEMCTRVYSEIYTLVQCNAHTCLELL